MEDVGPTTERCMHVPFGAWEFGDPPRAAKTFVLLAQRCVEQWPVAEDFERQRQQALQLLSAAVSCLLLANVEHALGVATCSVLLEEQGGGVRAPWLQPKATSAANPRPQFGRIIARLEELAVEVTAVTATETRTMQWIAQALRNQFRDLDGLRGN